jgi:hypothetical protein
MLFKNENNEFDTNRLMTHQASSDPNPTTLDQRIRATLLNLLPNWVKLSESNYIASKPNGGKQQPHFDFPPYKKYAKAVKDSYFIFIGFEDNTTLILFDKVCDESTGGISRWKRITVHLNKGDVFIGRGDLIHAGDDYPDSNLRCHLYGDSKTENGRKEDQTYFTTDEMLEEIENIISEDYMDYKDYTGGLIL